MKLAIVGTGLIVTEALKALSALSEIERVAICAREHSREKAEGFAAQYEIPAVYVDYDKMLAESEADTVYIGIVNTEHFSYAKRALEHGKNVILEKPFCTSLAETDALISLAKEKRLYLFEAMTSCHQPLYTKMQEALPKLGRICYVQGNYSQYSSRYKKYLAHEVHPAFDPAYYGGALYDLGIYALRLTTGLFGRPSGSSYFPCKGYNGVDLAGTLLLGYDGFNASLTAAKDSDSPCFYTVQGEEGYFSVDGKPNEMNRLIVSIGGERQVYDTPPSASRMEQEFREFNDCILRNDFETACEWLSQTRAAMEVLDGALQPQTTCGE